MRLLPKVFLCSALLVAGRLDMGRAARALTRRNSGGVYANPEGPLNILRGHPLLSNDMLTKKRKYAALVRTDYRYTRDLSDNKWAYTGDARNDGIRELDSSTAVMLYLKRYYRALEAMFTVVDGAAAINESLRATFLHRLTPEERLKLYAVLLVLAGGGDIRVRTQHHVTEGGAELHKVGFCVADTAKVLLELRLSPTVDGDALTVFRFFDNFGGRNAAGVVAYGLHHTDSPSFLIQAYVNECIGCEEDAVEIFKAARAILAELCDSDTNEPLWERFFTQNAALVQSYAPGYAAASEICREVASMRSASSQHVQPQQGQCVGLRAIEKMGNLSPSIADYYIHSGFLKLCCCLCYDPTTGSCSAERIRSAGVDPLKEFIDMVSERPERFEYSATCAVWNSIMHAMEVEFHEQAQPRANSIRFCYSDRLETDMGNYLMLLAKLFGFSADDTQQLSDQLARTAGDLGSASSVEDLSSCIRVLLDKYSIMLVCSVECAELVARDGWLRGSLKLEFGSRHRAGAPRLFHIKLVFTEGAVEFHYNPQSFVLSAERRAYFATAIGKLSACGETPFGAMVRGCIERFLGACDGKTPTDSSATDMLASNDSLVSYIALNEWMERRSLWSHGEVLAAVDQLLPSFEVQLERIRACDGAEREAWLERFACSPLVAVIDNILGNAELSDEAVRESLFNILRYCVDERSKLFPSICLPAGSYPRMCGSLFGCDSEPALACLADYDVPNMLLGQLKMRSRAALSAEQRAEFCRRSAEFVAKPWHDLVYPVLATFFRLAHAEGMEFVWRLCLPGLGDTSEDGYCKKAFWISLASCASPIEYHNAIREVCDLWADPFCDLSNSPLAFLSLQKNCKPEPLSLALINEVFPDGPTESQLQAVVRVFEIYASTYYDYKGIKEVLREYRNLVRVDWATYNDFIHSKTDILTGCFIAHGSALMKMEQCQSLLAAMPTRSLRCHLKDMSNEINRLGFYV
ncbi:hypothetical protein PAPHI01_0822 [Pancytospora philotis]|nr:hypothetical protein PAPHI01_0822 [Pancytospora philotis]